MRFPGLLFLLAAVTAFAGESVVLTSGARLHVDRHETDGDTVRLYEGSGYIEMDAAKVRGFEVDEPGSSPPVTPVPDAATISTAPVPVPAAPAALSPRQLADAAADKYGLPRKLVNSVMAAESAFQPK